MIRRIARVRWKFSQLGRKGLPELEKFISEMSVQGLVINHVDGSALGDHLIWDIYPRDSLVAAAIAARQVLRRPRAGAGRAGARA